MRKPEDVNPGVRHMALKLLELVWHKEAILRQGPKSIHTARINLGHNDRFTDQYFEKILEFALEQEMVFKVGDEGLSHYPPEAPEDSHQLRLGDIEQL